MTRPATPRPTYTQQQRALHIWLCTNGYRGRISQLDRRLDRLSTDLLRQSNRSSTDPASIRSILIGAIKLTELYASIIQSLDITRPLSLDLRLS